MLITAIAYEYRSLKDGSTRFGAELCTEDIYETEAVTEIDKIIKIIESAVGNQNHPVDELLQLNTIGKEF